MSCNGQLDLAAVTADRQGLLEDPKYISGLPEQTLTGPQNVAPLSISAAAGILCQYVSYNVAPGGFGDPGPLQYVFSTHELLRRDDASSEHCVVEADEGAGDDRIELTGPHKAAEQKRIIANSVDLNTRLLRLVDGCVNSVAGWLDGN